MRGRADGGQKKHLVPSICVILLVSGILFFYYGGHQGHHASVALDYGTKFSRSLGWGSNDDGDVAKTDESAFGQEDGDENIIPKSFPVSDFLIYNFIIDNQILFLT